MCREGFLEEVLPDWVLGSGQKFKMKISSLYTQKQDQEASGNWEEGLVEVEE